MKAIEEREKWSLLLVITGGYAGLITPLLGREYTLGGLRAWYESVKTDATSSRAPTNTEYDKDVWGLSFGIQYRFLD